MPILRCHILKMGVKSGLKDIGRALKIPFDKMNALSKIIDEDLEDVVPTKVQTL